MSNNIGQTTQNLIYKCLATSILFIILQCGKHIAVRKKIHNCEIINHLPLTFQNVDFIPVKVPKMEGHQMYVKGIKWGGSVEDLEVSTSIYFSDVFMSV